MTKVNAYVGAVAVLALVAVAALFRAAPSLDRDMATAALCFAALGFVAQVLQYQTGKAVSGSSALLPFLSAAVLAPTWVGCAAVSGAVLASALFSRTLTPIKIFFNVSQLTLATAAAILAYRGLGGEALSANVNIPAYIALVITFALVNTVAVSGVVALTEGRSVTSVGWERTVKNVAYDALSVPFVFAFVWAYTEWHLIGVAGLSIPLLGIRQLYKQNWQLEEAHRELLEMMVANLEARDPYTSGHSMRVARNARIIARAIGLNAKEVKRVAVAALLHDVGKIHEAFAPLLQKPGKLTPEEWVVMQTHPVKSAELVSKSAQLKDVVGAVRHHHENWDGSGYPDALAGDEIPLGARIIMFADTIDAMTTDRPYRRALSAEAVRDEFIKQRGRQFDPTICDRLLSSSQFYLLFVDGKRQHETPAFLPRFERSKKIASSR